MPNSRKHLDVIVDTQLDYLLPTRTKTYVDGAEKIVIPGLEWLVTRSPENCMGVLFTECKFSEEEYRESEFAAEFPPHCLVGGLGDYDPVGVQNVFSQRLLVSRGVPAFHLHKTTHSMWHVNGKLPTVHAFQGSSATAYGLNEFVGSVLRDTGVKRVNIWGIGSDAAVRLAIEGFLDRKFKVCVVTNLCASRGEDIEDVLEESFAEALKSGQLAHMLFVPKDVDQD